MILVNAKKTPRKGEVLPMGNCCSGNELAEDDALPLGNCCSGRLVGVGAEDQSADACRRSAENQSVREK